MTKLMPVRRIPWFAWPQASVRHLVERGERRRGSCEAWTQEMRYAVKSAVQCRAVRQDPIAVCSRRAQQWGEGEGEGDTVGWEVRDVAAGGMLGL